MNTVNAIIVDDEKLGVKTLKNLISEYCPAINIIGVTYAKDEAMKMIIQKSPDLVFLDIEMPHGNGFDLLKELPNRDFEVIFTTAYSEYALQAIKAHAIDYLLKPIDIKELIIAVESVRKKITKSMNSYRLNALLKSLDKTAVSKEKIAIATSDGVELVDKDSIIRMQAEGGYTWIYCTDRKRIISSKNLGAYEKILTTYREEDKGDFLRIHHSHLVNIRYVIRVNSKLLYVEMQDNTKIDIAQRKRTHFNKLIKKMM